jgi:acyl-CoA synthetase (AMP-forming)/AMP-acid ligase II
MTPAIAHAPLLGWLSRPSSRRGIRFAVRTDDWIFCSYTELAESARRVARGLIRYDLHEHDRVALIQGSSPGFVASLFGALLAGGVPVPLPRPERLQAREDIERHTAMLLRAVEPAFVVIEGELPATLQQRLIFPEGPKIVTVDELLEEEVGADSFERHPAELALLQFTSGSGGHCRAVRIPFAALEANVAAIHQWLEWGEGDLAASWLPFHHDMGLIGCLLGAVLRQGDLWLLDPEQFVRSPLRFLRCFGESGACLAALPNFALDYIVRRVRPEMLTGMDFSAWRALIIGSERLNAQSLADFHALLAPFGFRRTALSPAYGLAEATLAVTGLPLSEEPAQLELDPGSLAFGRSVRPIVGGLASRSSVIGCGRPLPGVSLTIESEAGQLLSDGQVGEIVVHGSSVAAGYYRAVADEQTRFCVDGLRTGDIGFLHAGQLFVLGRLGDSLKVRGRALFAEDVEAALIGLRIPSHRVAALLGWRKGEPTAVILLEPSASQRASELRSVLRPLIGEAQLLILRVAQNAIRRTSSGKVKRRELWQAFCEERLYHTDLA